MTGDLTAITGSILLRERGLWQKLRYFTAPPISEEDLWTLVGKKFKQVPESHAESAASALKSVLDNKRFGWVQQNRPPTDEEFNSAVMATTVLLTHETLKTNRRGASSQFQEKEVADALEKAGLTFDGSRSAILALDELPRGHFSRERKVAGAKCDIPIRLHDGRLLALECKVSNGPKNSWKRLQREVGGKSDTWKGTHGQQVITGAVLAGVFDMSCLIAAQNKQKVAIFWQHDLAPLISFVAETQKPTNSK
ncbi:XamI family restriction endonuclease [Rhizobium ruizarguesonis]|uniref:XamI family restriction endonuclease n=1 Tax=Rhizobium ruizarguesonis TaxID=2081791 RepID=UPI0013BF4366|nr:XamI family restriction endonuclease [Rhizobium ruizarguesonis]NEI98559.1 XamI family restriction endonuclease [Rhizobium ruizarguesonis]NEJ36106.1 XamI family restriction endonuclease [Rhizobium ruizarguesonis]